MNCLIILLLLFCSTIGYSQTYSTFFDYNIQGVLKKIGIDLAEKSLLTDSIRWETIEISEYNIGNKTKTSHQWVYGEEGCPLAHLSYCSDIWVIDFDDDALVKAAKKEGLIIGNVLSNYDMRRERICRVCLRHELQIRVWYQHKMGITPKEKTAFDILKERLNK